VHPTKKGRKESLNSRSTVDIQVSALVRHQQVKKGDHYSHVMLTVVSEICADSS